MDGKQPHCFLEKWFIASLKCQTFTKYLLEIVRRKKKSLFVKQVGDWHHINFLYTNTDRNF